MNVSLNKLVFDTNRKPNLAMMLKAPARANKNPRNLWLLLDTGISVDGLRDEGNEVAYVTGVIAEARLPEQYQRLPTRPLLNIGVSTYNDIRNQYHDYLGLPRPSTERAKRTPKRVMQERRAAQGRALGQGQPAAKKTIGHATANGGLAVIPGLSDLPDLQNLQTESHALEGAGKARTRAARV